jgi:hypothetical protein
MTIECVICLQQLTAKVHTLACLHAFCDICIDRWLDINNRCPICASIIGSKSINTLSNHEDDITPPCIDHLYPERQSLQHKLLHLQKRIQTKSDASIKACISKKALIDLRSRYQ